MPQADCIKCGCDNASIKYCEGKTSLKHVPGCEVDGEHLHRVCAMCGYEWLEYCADSALGLGVISEGS